MADILSLQGDDVPEVPGDPKGSQISYFVCVNSVMSTWDCWRL